MTTYHRGNRVRHKNTGFAGVVTKVDEDGREITFRRDDRNELMTVVNDPKVLELIQDDAPGPLGMSKTDSGDQVHILVVDDQEEEDIIEKLKENLDQEKYEIHGVGYTYRETSFDEYKCKLEQKLEELEDVKDGTVVLLDLQFDCLSNGRRSSEIFYGYDILFKDVLKKHGFDKVLIFSIHERESGFQEKLTREGLRSIQKPEDNRTEYYEYLKLLIEAVFLEGPDLRELGFIVGLGPKMMEVVRRIRQVAENKLPVLITGKSGTGKELVAKAIHKLGRGKDQEDSLENLHAINCSGIPNETLESSLFGHLEGSYTHAITDSLGAFTKAGGYQLRRETGVYIYKAPGLLMGIEDSGKIKRKFEDGGRKPGTLFLDEIGDLQLYHQAKILRAVEEDKVQPMGATFYLPVDVRLVAATNRDLKRMVDRFETTAGKEGFREDLLYRLNVVPVSLPSLSERFEEDPSVLARFFAHFVDKAFERINRDGSLTLLPEVDRYLRAREWRGNVREFENLLLAAVALMPRERKTLLLDDITRVSEQSTRERQELIDAYVNYIGAKECSTKKDGLIQLPGDSDLAIDILLRFMLKHRESMEAASAERYMWAYLYPHEIPPEKLSEDSRMRRLLSGKKLCLTFPYTKRIDKLAELLISRSDVVWHNAVALFQGQSSSTEQKKLVEAVISLGKIETEEALGATLDMDSTAVGELLRELGVKSLYQEDESEE